MHSWFGLSQIVYYTGAGAVLVGTTIRFLYRLFRDHDKREAFVDEIQDVHLVNIYFALGLIAHHMGIELPYPKQTTRR